MTRIHSGSRQPDGTTLVRVNGQALDPRPDFRSQSATTFDWGYLGRGGPAQLALAILADHFGDDERARRHCEAFTRHVIRGLPREGWTLSGAEIDVALSMANHSERPAVKGPSQVELGASLGVSTRLDRMQIARVIGIPSYLHFSWLPRLVARGSRGVASRRTGGFAS